MVERPVRIIIEITFLILLVILTTIFAGNTDIMLMLGECTLCILVTILVVFKRDLRGFLSNIFKNPSGRFFVALVLLAIFQGLGFTGLSIYPAHSFRSTLTILSCFFAYAIASEIFNQGNSLKRFFVFLMIFGAIQSVIGLSQAFSGRSTLFGMLTLPRGWRAYGTFYNPDHFSAFLELCFFSTLGMISSILPSKERFLRWRDRIHSLSTKERNLLLLIGFCSLLILLTIIYTKSRMGIFATFVGVVFFVLQSIQSRRQSVAVRRASYIVALMLVISAYLGLETIIERYRLAGVDLDPEYGSRGSLWRTSINSIAERPLLGSGIGTFWLAYQKHQPVHLQGFYTHAHNDFIEAGVEFGVVGLIIILVGGILYFRDAIRIFRERHNPWARGLGLGGISGLLAVAIHSAGDFVLRTYINGILFSVMLVVAYNSLNMDRRR